MPRIELQGAVNVRDVGGMSAGTAAVRLGRLIRTETPEFFTDADVEKIVAEHNVTAVVDLRSPWQTTDGSGAIGRRVQRHVVDFIELSGGVRATGEWLTAQRWLEGQLRTVGPVWLSFLNVLCDNTSGATLLHCQSGKDRTGLIVALTLLLVGVDRPSVEADYLLSADVHEQMTANLIAAGKWRPDLPPFVLEPVSPVSIRNCLDYLEREWTDAGRFCLAHGGSQELIARVRAHLCVQ